MKLQYIKMYLGVVVLGLLLIIFARNSSGEDDERPEYKLILDKMIKEKETVTIIENNLTFDEGNTIKISGELKQLVDLDDDWKLSLSVFRANAADAEYTPLMAFAPMGVCEMLKTKYKMYFYDTVKENVSNAPEPTECPVLKRTYQLQSYELDTNKYKKFLKPGYYRVIGILKKDDNEVLKYIFDLHVEEVK